MDSILTHSGLKFSDLANKPAEQILDFVQNHAPSVLQQFIKCNLLWSSIWTSFWLVLLFYTITYTISYYKKYKSASDKVLKNFFIGLMYTSTLGIIISFILFLINAEDLYKILFAKQLWILENIKDIFK